MTTLGSGFSVLRIYLGFRGLGIGVWGFRVWWFRVWWFRVWGGLRGSGV